MDAAKRFTCFIAALIDERRDGLSKFLIVGGLIVTLVPLTTEVYGMAAQYKLKQEWDELARQQSTLSQELRKEQLDVYGERKFIAEESVLRTQSKYLRADRKKGPFPNTRIIIQKLGLDQVILEGVDGETLRNGPGHYPQTVNPGDRGNVAIAGHRVTYTAPFNRLDELVEGDSIVLQTLDTNFEYRMTKVEVRSPDDVSNLKPTSDYRLTLTTCTPKYSAQARLNLVATLYKTAPRREDVVKTVKKALEKVEFKEEVKVPKDDVLGTIKDVKNRLAKNPRDIDALIMAGNAYFEIERYSEAIKYLNKAARISQANPGVKQLKAQIDEREEQLRKETTLRESSVVTELGSYMALGEIFIAKGEYDEAIAVLETATRIDPIAADIMYELAICYEQVGQYERAIELLRGVIQFVPDYKEALQALDRIYIKIKVDKELSE